jgi:hypothetical protein
VLRSVEVCSRLYDGSKVLQFLDHVPKTAKLLEFLHHVLTSEDYTDDKIVGNSISEALLIGVPTLNVSIPFCRGGCLTSR